ncbi:MAG: hypothetical protein ACT4P8_07050 [Betaproteobacteria bacterium]
MSGDEREIGESVVTRPQRWLLFLRRSPGRQAGARAALWAVLILVAALLIHWGYGEHRKRALPKIVVTLAQDASARLQDALRSEIDESEGEAATGERLERHAIAVDRSLTKLRDMETEPIAELAAAADDYLLTAREILRRRAADYRYRAVVAEGMRSLRTHMRTDDRTGAWISQAVRLKTKLETDLRRYRLTAAALGNLLEQYTDSRSKIAPYVEPSRLTSDTVVGAARTRLQGLLTKLSDQVQQASQLDAYR